MCIRDLCSSKRKYGWKIVVKKKNKYYSPITGTRIYKNRAEVPDYSNYMRNVYSFIHGWHVVELEWHKRHVSAFKYLRDARYFAKRWNTDPVTVLVIVKVTGKNIEEGILNGDKYRTGLLIPFKGFRMEV